METNQIKPRVSGKDTFLNLGAFISLYALVISLLNLLFSVINTAYPKITDGYNYSGSASISWPVAALVVFFPILILLMWFLEKEYRVEPNMQDGFFHRGLTYVTLLISGLAIAGDLITVLYYFIDGQELTTGFLLKVLVLLVVASGLFIYFISDLRDKLTAQKRIFWRVFAGVIILGSIIWGFSVLGSPRTQRLYKYDEQKVSDLQSIDNQVASYYSTKGMLPKNIEEMASGNYYVAQVDSQNQKPYEYKKTSNTTYNLCAEFNKESPNATAPNTSARFIGYQSWIHPSGHYCFEQTINPNTYAYPKPQ